MSSQQQPTQQAASPTNPNTAGKSAVDYASARSRSPLTKDLKWPTDLDMIQRLHSGADWKFFLVCLIRTHIIKNHLQQDFVFTARDPKQAYPFIIELSRLFNPISMLSLYKELIDHYIDLVIKEQLPFNEQHYLSILRSYHSIEDWEHVDWFWSFALRQVVFAPVEGLEKIRKQLPVPTDWAILSPSNHTGYPEGHLLERFGGLLTRLGNNFLIVSNDLLSGPNKVPNVNTTGRWGIMHHRNSPFQWAVPHVDQFYLSLYPRVEGASFAFSMALDLLQYNFTLADWKYNTFASRVYWKLCHADDKGLLRLNQPAEPASQSKLADLHNNNNNNDDGALGEQLNEPQPFTDLRLAIKLRASDVCFDFCSDYELSLIVTDLQLLCSNVHLPNKQRAMDFLVLEHLKSKIDLFNTVQLQAGNNAGQ